MFRSRQNKSEPATSSSPHLEIVFATTDVSKGGRVIRKGDAVRRDHVMVQERPDLFEVRYPLSEELND